MKPTIYCICGRTASGKDTIAHIVSEHYDLPIVVSYTTRPKRSNETNNVEHIFISDEEADNILSTQETLAYTQIGEYRYFTTVDQIKSDTIYIIDPIGIESLKSHFNSRFNIKVIYVWCDGETRLKRASTRSDFSTAFEQRNKDEADQFNALDKSRSYDIILFNDDDKIDTSYIYTKFRGVIFSG